MDNKTKNGTLGEIATIKRLVEEDYEVYTSINGKGSFDLVAYREDVGIIRIEVKSTTQSTNNAYKIGLRRIRANTTECVQHLFSKNRQEVLAIYIVELDCIIFINVNKIKVTSELTIQKKDVVNLFEQSLLETLADRPSGGGLENPGL